VRLSLLLFLATAVAQEVTFRATVPVVVTPVTVTDGKGRMVDGLEAYDIQVSDNGRSVAFRMDTVDTLTSPLALVVVVQTNDVSAHALLKIRKVGAMLQPLITGERGAAAVVTYADRAEVAQEFTQDAGEMTRALARLKPAPSRTARMIDAVSLAADRLTARPAGERRVILLLGESRDRGSETALEAALEHLQRSNIQLYAATYSTTKTQFTTKGAEMPRPSGGGLDLIGGLGELVRLGKTNTAEALAAHSGGRKLPFSTLRGLESLLTRVGTELHGQYIVSFPASGPAGYHVLEVSLKQGRGRIVAARQGYWAVAQ
jgi:VWFA-related protein